MRSKKNYSEAVPDWCSNVSAKGLKIFKTTNYQSYHPFGDKHTERMVYCVGNACYTKPCIEWNTLSFHHLFIWSFTLEPLSVKAFLARNASRIMLSLFSNLRPLRGCDGRTVFFCNHKHMNAPVRFRVLTTCTVDISANDYSLIGCGSSWNSVFVARRLIVLLFVNGTNCWLIQHDEAGVWCFHSVFIPISCGTWSGWG